MIKNINFEKDLPRWLPISTSSKTYQNGYKYQLQERLTKMVTNFNFKQNLPRWLQISTSSKTYQEIYQFQLQENLPGLLPISTSSKTYRDCYQLAAYWTPELRVSSKGCDNPGKKIIFVHVRAFHSSNSNKLD